MGLLQKKKKYFCPIMVFTIIASNFSRDFYLKMVIVKFLAKSLFLTGREQRSQLNALLVFFLIPLHYDLEKTK